MRSSSSSSSSSGLSLVSMLLLSFRRWWLLLVVALSLISCTEAEETADAVTTTTCSISYGYEDPNLKPLTYDVGDGPQTTLVYVTPDVTTFYRNVPPPAKTAVTPKHKGLAAKFINMSNQKIRLYWEPTLHSKSKSLMRVIPPFSSTGSASFPGHLFFVTSNNKEDDGRTILQRWEVADYPNSVYVYDPYLVPGDDAATRANVQQHLTPDERLLYEGWNKTRTFNEIYRNFTGRSYLANYLRAPPKHFMWPAEYFGQEHWITTRETHFTKMPPSSSLNKILHHGTSRIVQDHEPRLLSEYRNHNTTTTSTTTTTATLNLTLRVLSCAPRVFEIEHFLSPIEVAHVLHIAAGVDLQLSVTGDLKPGDESDNSVMAAAAEEQDEGTTKTRTSYNSWVEREESPIVDAIYRRAADVLRMDEALLRYRPDGERPDFTTTKTSIAEHLQLVHYDVTQEYTAHHDFGFNEISDQSQPERFSTLLLYLNEGMQGGETSFPRWINAETFDELRVTPKAGKAVLFYDILPDGNMDDFSQHAALPVRAGDKWLTNLWVWDPHYGEEN